VPLYELTVNQKKHSLEAEPGTSLLYVLREMLGLMGAKAGCNEGQCGSCTVLLGGQPVRACITAISAVRKRPVITIEGLEQRGELHPAQQAFLETSAFQCGYCTPGMILRAVALLEQTPAPNESQVRSAMQGNVCRCGTYPRIVEAVRLAARGGRRG
jgi:aerobic-type carbon monoxide dehydrogenase small subunit (CoxS/CutS family)